MEEFGEIDRKIQRAVKDTMNKLDKEMQLDPVLRLYAYVCAMSQAYKMIRNSILEDV